MSITAPRLPPCIYLHHFRYMFISLLPKTDARVLITSLSLVESVNRSATFTIVLPEAAIAAASYTRAARPPPLATPPADARQHDPMSARNAPWFLTLSYTLPSISASFESICRPPDPPRPTRQQMLKPSRPNHPQQMPQQMAARRRRHQQPQTRAGPTRLEPSENVD